MKKILSFIKRVIGCTIKTLKSWIIETIQNAEAATLLCFSAIGATALISEIPFHMTLPFWIETPMVAPVLGIIAVLFLIQTMKWRGITCEA